MAEILQKLCDHDDERLREVMLRAASDEQGDVGGVQHAIERDG
jgi:hypothetical protein